MQPPLLARRICQQKIPLSSSIKNKTEVLLPRSDAPRTQELTEPACGDDQRQNANSYGDHGDCSLLLAFA